MRQRQSYYLKQLLNLGGSLQILWTTVSTVRVPLTEAGPKCALAVKLQDWPRGAWAPLFIWLRCTDVGAYLAQWQESLWLAKTLPCDKRAVFDYPGPTTQTILDLSTVTRSMALLSLKVRSETNSHSSQGREAVLLLHDTLPQVVKVSTLYYRVQSQWSYNKNKSRVTI